MKPLQIGNLTVRYPIVQGGMGVGISLSGLASAVARQGGIGILSAVGIGLLEGDNKNFRTNNQKLFEREIKKARALAPDGVLGANIMFAVTDFDDMFRIALEQSLDIIIVGAGLFLKIPPTVDKDQFINSQTKYAPKLSSARAVNLTLKVWDEKFGRLPDAFVIEGPKAGGHLGFKKNELTDELKPLDQIIKEVKQVIKPYEDKYGQAIPVIAAGGIYTGYDMFDIMQAGADAVKIGTRFVTTEECDADIRFKQEFIRASKNDIVIIDSPVGLPGRAVENDFIRSVNAGETKPIKCEWRCLKTCDWRKVPYCIAQALANAAKGNLDEGFAFAGSNAYRATKIETVPEVFAQLIDEYQKAKINATVYS